MNDNDTLPLCDADGILIIADDEAPTPGVDVLDLYPAAPPLCPDCGADVWHCDGEDYCPDCLRFGLPQ